MNPVSDNLIEVKALYKSYSNNGTSIPILTDLDFSLKPGETVAVVGASGIGKSTFLHMLGALDRPDKGGLWFEGEDVFAFDNMRLARFRNESVGFVFQFHHLLPEFSAIENTMMPALIRRMSKANARLVAKDILTRVGLEQRMLHKVSKLSGGEQQRVALARALALKPAILLADEPTGNLDKERSDQIHRLLVELNVELGMTLVVVTHNMELARCMSRIVTLKDGQIVNYEL
jgi:lipoprotein-releasing system ATP-binding protein